MTRKSLAAIYLIGLMLAMLAVVGCSTTYIVSSGGSDRVSIPSEEKSGVLIVAEPNIAVISDPWFTYPSLYMEGIDVNSLPYYPVKMPVGNLHSGAVVDTWKESLIFKDRPDYSIDKGLPVGINIHNPSSENKTVDLSIDPSLAMTDADTGIEYAQTPVACLSWVELSRKSVVIPPNAIAHIPVRIIVPNDISTLKIPPKWEFWITVVERKTNDYYQTGGIQRWMISMR